MSTGLADRFRGVYVGYGPGRLPGADRRDVGGGYAFASAMVVFCLVYVLYPIVGAGWSTPDPVVSEDPVPAGVAFLLVVLSGFVAGYLVWRYLPERLSYFGVAAGLTASLATHLLVILGIDVVVNLGIGYLTPVEKLTGVFIAYPGLLRVITAEFLDVATVMYLVGVAGGSVYERIRAA